MRLLGHTAMLHDSIPAYIPFEQLDSLAHRRQRSHLLVVEAYSGKILLLGLHGVIPALLLLILLVSILRPRLVGRRGPVEQRLKAYDSDVLPAKVQCRQN